MELLGVRLENGLKEYLKGNLKRNLKSDLKGNLKGNLGGGRGGNLGGARGRGFPLRMVDFQTDLSIHIMFCKKNTRTGLFPDFIRFRRIPTGAVFDFGRCA
jgi:hypothetical protein